MNEHHAEVVTQIKHGLEEAVEELEDGNDPEPVLFLLGVIEPDRGERVNAIVSLSMLDLTDDNKDAIASMMRSMVTTQRPEATVFVSCAWLAFADDEHPLDTPASQHPNRREVVLVMYENREGESVMHSAEIIRHGDHGELAEWTTTEGFSHYSGRFTLSETLRSLDRIPSQFSVSLSDRPE